MDDVHLAQRCLADASQFFEVKSPSYQFVDAYVQGFGKLERKTDQHVDVLVALILEDPSVYGRFQQLDATIAPQKLLAATNYARCAGHFPDLKVLMPYALYARAVDLAECLMHKEERELVEHYVELVYFVQNLQFKTQAAVSYLRYLKARAVVGSKQVLPLFLLRRLLPTRFESSGSQELQNLVFSIYQAVCRRNFNVDGIVLNLFYYNNGIFALPWAHFGVNLKIFKNIKTSVESLLFLCIKMDSLATDAFRAVIDTRMFKLLPGDDLRPTLFYAASSQQWYRNLIENIGKTSLPAVQLLFIYKLAEYYSYADILPQFSQVQQFCAAQQLDKQLVADLKRLYAENNRLYLFWQEYPFEVCLTALFNAQKEVLGALQIIYMVFVGRKFPYYIINDSQFIDPQIAATARRLSANFQEGVFLTQCSPQYRTYYAGLQSLSYLIPVQAGAHNLVLRTLHALNGLTYGKEADFAELFGYLLYFGDIYQIIQLTQQKHISVKLPRERLQMSAIQKEMLVSVLQSFYQTLQNERVHLLISILQHSRANPQAETLLDSCPRAMFHPKLYTALEVDFEALKAAVEQDRLSAVDSLVFPLQIGEFLQKYEEIYALCNPALFVLLLFTGDFENELQLYLTKILLAMLQRYGCADGLYEAAAQDVRYDSNGFYAKYVLESQLLHDVGKQVGQARRYCQVGSHVLLPIVTGQALFQLLKQSTRYAFFSFGVDVCFEVNYKSLDNVTEAEFLNFVQSTAFSSLGAFRQHDFTLPSLFGQKIPLVKAQLNEYTNIVRLRYENEALYEAVRYHIKSEFPDLARLLSVSLSQPAQRSVVVLLNCRVPSVWKKLAEVRSEDDVRALVRNPYAGMMKKYQAARYAEIFALMQKCGEEAIRNISFE